MTPKQFAKSYNKHNRSIRTVANAEGLTYHRAHKLFQQARDLDLIDPRDPGGQDKDSLIPKITGRIKALETTEFSLPKKGQVRRYLFSCAQNNTRLHEPLWENLLALAEHYDARLMISRFCYVKRGLGSVNDKANFLKEQRGRPNYEVAWDRRIDPYLHDERAEIAPGLMWCGEQNILPTAVRPLSGLETYTGRWSGIFPHVKIAMESVPSSKYDPTKFNYTTGTVTQRNYIQRKAGLKAEFHHCYGALLVEVTDEGDWFCRQINADSEGVLYDLDVRVKDGKVKTGCRVEAVSWGDIHVVQINEMVSGLAWGPGGMLDSLRPRYQFMHDVLDFKSRNHHDRKNPHAMYKTYQLARDDVAEELIFTARFLNDTARRDWCRTVVVESNHDNALERWLRDDPKWYAQDPLNAVTFLKLQLAKYESLGAYTAEGMRFLLVEYALKEFGALRDNAAQFLREDESFVICHDKGGGIECGMHGHIGPNGARGGANTFARMGRKANVGHTHSAGIVDGIYTAGTSSNLDMEYNKGPSSWSHSHVVTYANGKRAIITMWNGRWRA